LHSAVSPICNRQGVGKSQRAWPCGRSAGCNPALRQIANLRYDTRDASHRPRPQLVSSAGTARIIPGRPAASRLLWNWRSHLARRSFSRGNRFISTKELLGASQDSAKHRSSRGNEAQMFLLSGCNAEEVRASLRRLRLTLRACPKRWGRLPACRFMGRPRPVFRAAGYRPNRQTRCLPHIFGRALRFCRAFLVGTLKPHLFSRPALRQP
jgi:hypothetical protein